MVVIEQLMVMGVSVRKRSCQKDCPRKEKAPEDESREGYKCINGTWTQQLNPDVTSSGMYVELY
jgi:hypothetical protein